MDYMLTVHTHTNCFAEQPCQLAPPCCHTQHTAGMYTHIIMQGDVSGPLHYAWSSGEPGQWSVRERPRSEPHCRTHVSTVTPPLHGPQTHIHTHACAHTHTHTHTHPAHTRTHRSVVWQICTRTHSPAACQTKVNVICSVSRFHCLWIGYANVIQHRLASTWLTYFSFSQRSCTTCSLVSCSCLMPFVLIMCNIHMLSSLITLQVLIGL